MQIRRNFFVDAQSPRRYFINTSFFKKLAKSFFFCDNVSMDILGFIKNKLIINPFKYLAVFVAGLAFSAGLVFAWNAVWHGTDWIQSGAVVDAQKVGENFEYLKKQIEDLNTRLNNIENSSTTNITIEDMPSGTVVAGCMAGNIMEKTNVETPMYYWCWGGASVKNYYPYFFKRYTYTCPKGTKKRLLFVNLYSYDSHEGTESHAIGTYGALCIKL